MHKKLFKVLDLVRALHFRAVARMVLATLVMAYCSIKGYGQASLWNPNFQIGTVTAVYDFSYNQTPDQLVQLLPPAYTNQTVTFQWEYSLTPTTGFASISGTGAPQITGTSTQSTLTFAQPLSQTMYFRCKASVAGALPLAGFFTFNIYSNIIKISVVSVNWEDVNYIRAHDVLTTAQTDWKAIDQLSIGQKLQTTTYLDGLGRPVEKVSRETATPSSGSLWGDVVQFSQYDQMGREQTGYLPYTTTTQSGKFKTAPLTEQPQYYSNTYNETSAFSSITFDNSPLNRINNVKESGQSWAAAAGNSGVYDVNDATDNVQIWTVDYTRGDAPVNNGSYAPGTLYKTTRIDENNHKVIEYVDESGQVILTKVQIDAVPSAAHAGWICTYKVYDDFGSLRYQIQPEGVKYLDANGWSFAGANGQAVLAEQCFQYDFDDKRRPVWKKSPGISAQTLLYDIRDRMIFAQDGNQAGLTTPQWTTHLYDELDRNVITALYYTTEAVTNLQNDINSAVSTTLVNATNSGQPVIDLVVTNRQAGISQYTAQNSITFASEGNGGFQSLTGDEFVAQIDPAATTIGFTVSSTVLGNPISATNLSNPSVTSIIKYRFYDNYSFTLVKSFDNNFTNLSAYNTSDPNVLPISPSTRAFDAETGSLTRILETSVFLAKTNYYDEKGRPIQTLEDKIKTGVDVKTIQYHFDGHILSLSSMHTAPGTDYAGFTTLSKFICDKLGRVTSIQEQIGANAFKTISSYDFDDLGRFKVRHLDPDYNNPNSGAPDLESLNYTYNIHNQIIGINKDYALKTPATYNKWAHFFGLYLGFDNRDAVFNAAQLNGQVTGQLWNTQGDDAQRKYDYTYDNAGRLINASYHEQQHPGDGWSNSTMDFSVSGSGGQISYDYNGNLLGMSQKGIIPGTATPLTIDDLTYTYYAHSNKLQNVTDQMTNSSLNGQFGDFKDGANTTGTPDYVYDNNGNVVIDLNKNSQSLNNGAPGTNGISYNFLDKPEQIRIVGKGTIRIVYDADGNKLQRSFIPETGSSQSNITTYIGKYTYQETATLTTSSPAPFSGSGSSLSYIDFEEGRIRIITPTSQSNGYDALSEAGNITLPNGKAGVWDYFIKDYQGNVRMILTEESHSAMNTCTMETTNSRPSAEDPVFGQTGASNEVETTRYPTPSGWQSVNSSASVSRLGNTAGHNIGPNTLQKVMAGDQINASVQYYYQSPATSSNPNIIPNILNSLLGALGSNATTGTLVHGNGPAITSQLSGVTGFTNAVEPNNNTTGTPQAYLTILFFDERFNFIAAADGGVAQQQVASTWTTSTAPLGLTNVKAPKNGYAYVYVSNRSDQDVYFDNLAVSVTAGNIIEEDHYYAFGLKIAGISSKKLGDGGEGVLKNPYLYNSKEFVDDGDIDWYDYGYRNYDPQIGRFASFDPLADRFSIQSPYLYALNDPIGNVDVDGLFGDGDLTTCVVVGYKTTKATSQVSSVALNFTKIVITSASATCDLVNSSVDTKEPGNSIHWKVQNTTDFINAAAKGNYFVKGSGHDIRSLGNVYEEQVLKSTGDKKNNKTINNSRPDFVTSAMITYNQGSPYQVVTAYYNCVVGDVKFKSELPLIQKEREPKYQQQLVKFIDYLATVTGGSTLGVDEPGMDPKKVGVNILVIIGPANLVLGQDLLDYAKSKHVAILQKYTEVDADNPNIMRVAPGGKFYDNGIVNAETNDFLGNLLDAGKAILVDWIKYYTNFTDDQ